MRKIPPDDANTPPEAGGAVQPPAAEAGDPPKPEGTPTGEAQESVATGVRAFIRRLFGRSSASKAPEVLATPPQKPTEEPWTEERVIALAKKVDERNTRNYEELKKILDEAGAINIPFFFIDESQELEKKENEMVMCFGRICRCGGSDPQAVEKAREFLKLLEEYQALNAGQPMPTQPASTEPQSVTTTPPTVSTPPTPPPPPPESEEDIEPAEPVEDDAIEPAELAEGETAFSRPKSLDAAKKRMKRALRSLWRRHAAGEDVTPEIIKDALQHWFGDGVLSQEVLGRLCGPIQKGFLSADHTSTNREISEILQSLFPAQPTPEQWWEHERKAVRWLVGKIKGKIQNLFRRQKKPVASSTAASSEDIAVLVEPKTISEAQETLSAFLAALRSVDLADHGFVWQQIDSFFGKSIPPEYKNRFEWLAFRYCLYQKRKEKEELEDLLEQIWNTPGPTVDQEDFEKVQKNLESALSGSHTFKEFGEAIQRNRDLNNIFTKEEIRQLWEVRRSRDDRNVEIQKLVEVLKAKNVVFNLEGYIPKYIERLRAVFDSLEGQQATVENVTKALKTNEIDSVSQAEIPRIVELCTAHERDRRNMDRILTDALVRMEAATPVDDDVIVDERIKYAEMHEAPSSLKEAIERVQMTIHVLVEKHDAGISITSKVIEEVLTLCFGSGCLSPDVLARLRKQLQKFFSSTDKETRRAIFHQIKAILQPLFLKPPPETPVSMPILTPVLEPDPILVPEPMSIPTYTATPIAEKKIIFGSAKSKKLSAKEMRDKLGTNSHRYRMLHLLSPSEYPLEDVKPLPPPPASLKTPEAHDETHEQRKKEKHPEKKPVEEKKDEVPHTEDKKEGIQKKPEAEKQHH